MFRLGQLDDCLITPIFNRHPVATFGNLPNFVVVFFLSGMQKPFIPFQVEHFNRIDAAWASNVCPDSTNGQFYNVNYDSRALYTRFFCL